LNIQIQVLSVGVETKPTTKGSYQVAEVAYKDLTNGGKISAKKLMSFTNKEVFETFVVAKATEVYDIEMVKGEKYWDWTKATKGVASAIASPSGKTTTGSVGTVGNGRGFETPEERAKKQIFIVRQSSLTNAIATLVQGRKTELKPEEVIGLAQQYEAFVFGTGTVEATVGKDVGSIEDLEEDPIPY